MESRALSRRNRREASEEREIISQFDSTSPQKRVELVYSSGKKREFAYANNNKPTLIHGTEKPRRGTSQERTTRDRSKSNPRTQEQVSTNRGRPSISIIEESQLDIKDKSHREENNTSQTLITETNLNIPKRNPSYKSPILNYLSPRLLCLRRSNASSYKSHYDFNQDFISEFNMLTVKEAYSKETNQIKS